MGYGFHPDVSIPTLLLLSHVICKETAKEHTVGFVPEGEAAKAAGAVPLPIKINGTKPPCMLPEFYLPGSLRFHPSLTKPSFWALLSPGCLWHRVKDIIKGKGARNKHLGGASHTPNTHTCKCAHIQAHAHIHTLADRCIFLLFVSK